MSTPSSRRITMAEVARRSGVSPMTVSYCYSQPERVAPQTLRHVLATAAELGYQGPDPTAQSLRRRRNGAIGVVLGEHLAYAFEDPQARRFLTGIAEVCRERGSGINLIPTTGEATDVERVRAAAVDGYVVWATADDDPVPAVVGALDKPVAIHGGPATDGAQVVSIDNRASARALAGHTFAGARRPAVLSFPFDRARRRRLETGPDPAGIGFPVTRDRLQGVYDHCREAGIDACGLPVAVAAHTDPDHAAWTAGMLLDSYRPDAVVAMSDVLAIAVLDGARDRGLHVPDDIAVGGWDDGPDAEARGLTTITQSLFDQGRTCALIALGGEGSSDAQWAVTLRNSTR